MNIDRVRFMRRKELDDLAFASAQEIAAFDSQTNLGLIVESSVRAVDGCIILQTDKMRKVLNDSENASQTDTIEGFVLDQYLPSINLTVTSTFCALREKWVPTMFGILFGKTTQHYAIYFFTLLKNMNYKNFQDFTDNYFGMVCDFSDAERKGFEDGLQRHFNIDKDSYSIEMFYAFCTIHFDRSECRIRRNHAIVPAQRADEFKLLVHKLKEPMERAVFDTIVADIKNRFPKCKKWLDWYLHTDRAKMIFPAMTDESFVSDCRNTNAEESMGRTIQMSCEHDNPTLVQTYFHLYQWAARHDFEYSCACQGLPIRYGTPRVKRKRENDGRAPDTTDAIFGKKPKKTGRPKNARNKAPSGDSIVDLTLSIPWSYEYVSEDSNLEDVKRIKVTNTCAMDTVLMGVFLLHKYDDELFTDFKRDESLCQILDLIRGRRYAQARHEFIIHTEEVSKVPTENRPVPGGVILAMKMKARMFIIGIVNQLSWTRSMQ